MNKENVQRYLSKVKVKLRESGVTSGTNLKQENGDGSQDMGADFKDMHEKYSPEEAVSSVLGIYDKNSPTEVVPGAVATEMIEADLGHIEKSGGMTNGTFSIPPNETVQVVTSGLAAGVHTPPTFSSSQITTTTSTVVSRSVPSMSNNAKSKPLVVYDQSSSGYTNKDSISPVSSSIATITRTAKPNTTSNGMNGDLDPLTEMMMKNERRESYTLKELENGSNISMYASVVNFEDTLTIEPTEAVKIFGANLDEQEGLALSPRSVSRELSVLSSPGGSNGDFTEVDQNVSMISDTDIYAGVNMEATSPTASDTQKMAALFSRALKKKPSSNASDLSNKEDFQVTKGEKDSLAPNKKITFVPETKESDGKATVYVEEESSKKFSLYTTESDKKSKAEEGVNDDWATISVSVEKHQMLQQQKQNKARTSNMVYSTTGKERSAASYSQQLSSEWVHIDITINDQSKGNEPKYDEKQFKQYKSGALKYRTGQMNESMSRRVRGRPKLIQQPYDPFQKWMQELSTNDPKATRSRIFCSSSSSSSDEEEVRPEKIKFGGSHLENKILELELRTAASQGERSLVKKEAIERQKKMPKYKGSLRERGRNAVLYNPDGPSGDSLKRNAGGGSAEAWYSTSTTPISDGTDSKRIKTKKTMDLSGSIRVRVDQFLSKFSRKKSQDAR